MSGITGVASDGVSDAVFGNLARDTRRQIIESYFSTEDAVRKRGINLAADQPRFTLSRDEGDHWNSC